MQTQSQIRTRTLLRAILLALTWAALGLLLYALVANVILARRMGMNFVELVALQARFVVDAFPWLLVYVAPSALATAALVFFVARRLDVRLRWAIVSSLLLAPFGTYFFYPVQDRCMTSVAARRLIVARLTEHEARTLRTPSTLSDWNQICPLYFEYEAGDEVVMISAAPDLIHGMKLFQQRRPRVVRPPVR